MIHVTVVMGGRGKLYKQNTSDKFLEPPASSVEIQLVDENVK